MIRDKLLNFEPTALAASTLSLGANASTDELDMAVVAPNLGEGTRMMVSAWVATAITSGTNTSIRVDIEDSADGAAYATIHTGEASANNPAAGTKLLEVQIPTVHRRFLRLNWQIITAVATGGTLHAGIDFVGLAGNNR